VCTDEFQATLDCAGDDVEITCTDSGPAVAGCEAEVAALNGCTDQCTGYCAAAIAAGCGEGSSSLDDCVSGCKEALFSCPDQFVAVVECLEDSAGFGCVDGQPVPQGCGAEQSALELCVNPCDGQCKAVIAAGCEGGPQTVEKCVAACKPAVQSCGAQLEAVIACTGPEPIFSCAGEFPSPVGCGDEQAELLECVNACEIACPAVVAAGCGDDDLESCIDGCSEAQQQCTAEFNAVLACSGATPTYECTDFGPSAVGCADEQLAVIACLSPCDVSCTGLLALPCAPPISMETCVEDCELAHSVCPQEFEDFAACGGIVGGYTCVDGLPALATCEEFGEALALCGGECAAQCSAMVDAGCPEGPQTVEQCVDGCLDVAVQCGDQFDAALDCIGDEPAYACTGGSPVPVGCAAEQAEVVYCIDPCEVHCAAVEASDCGGEDAAESCAKGCAQALEFCPEEFDAVSTCTGSSPVYECLDGQPSPVGCGALHAELLECAVPPEIDCGASCPAVVEANCDSGPKTLDDCLAGCELLKDGDCAELQSLVGACAGVDSSYYCGEGGFPTPEGCEDESQALAACLAE